jgi:DNA-directed RNA polymerase specialized sigma24 family protein
MDTNVMPDPARLDADALLEHAGWVRALAARLARDQAEADDAAQDALAAALARPPRAGRPVRPWLGRVLGNALRARRRAEGRRAVHEAASARQRTQADGERTGDAASLLEVLEQQRRLTDLVADLPEPYRAAILARYFRGV